MGAFSKIAWTDHTFNPWWGCTRVSAGCQHCYAEGLANRWGFKCFGSNARRTFSTAHWNEPLKWARDAKKAGTKAKVFCASMADVFEDAPGLDEQRERLWKLIRDTSDSLIWQLLTKRSERIAQCLPPDWVLGWPNVWLGVTIENAAARSRLFNLNQIPARVWFASFEPLVGDVGNLGLGDSSFCGNMALDWAIIGAESGPGERPMKLEWAQAIIDQCKASSTPVFVKQIHLPDGKLSKDPAEWPEALRLHEFPVETR